MNAVLDLPAMDLEPHTKKWSLAEFHELCDQGHFQNHRVELVAGDLLVMPRQDFVHTYALTELYEFCRGFFHEHYWVRYQLPVHLGGDSFVEPDVSVVAGGPEHYQNHPDAALFVAEVSHKTLKYDRTRKGSLYARAGIPEYWIVNLPAKQLEVYRNPHQDDSQVFGFGFDEPVIHQPGDAASLLLRPDHPLDLKRLFR